MKARVQKLMQRYLQGEREGFSLVELIIVIAIMAILIAVVALAVIPYINSAREGKAHDAVNNVQSVFKSVMAKETYAKQKDKLATAQTIDDADKSIPGFKESLEKLTDKDIATTEKDLASGLDGLTGAKLYFQVDGNKCVVFLSKDGKAIAEDSDKQPFKAE